jgi:hypothetical protein
MNTRAFIATLLSITAMIGFPFLLPATYADSNTHTINTNYSPVLSYQGPYSANAVYFRPMKRSDWKVSLAFPTTNKITCTDALSSLRQTGLWEGHLNPDGSCFPPGSEPSYWALGNRLNHDTP